MTFVTLYYQGALCWRNFLQYDDAIEEIHIDVGMYWPTHSSIDNICLFVWLGFTSHRHSSDHTSGALPYIISGTNGYLLTLCFIWKDLYQIRDVRVAFFNFPSCLFCSLCNFVWTEVGSRDYIKIDTFILNRQILQKCVWIVTVNRIVLLTGCSCYQTGRTMLYTDFIAKLISPKQ
jgi:hypothetical protein